MDSRVGAIHTAEMHSPVEMHTHTLSPWAMGDFCGLPSVPGQGWTTCGLLWACFTCEYVMSTMGLLSVELFAISVHLLVLT